MRAKTVLQISFVSGLCAVLCPLVVAAQLSKRTERCLPYPTLETEIKNMHDEVVAKTAPQVRPQQIFVEDVEFAGPTKLSDLSRHKVTAELEKRTFDIDSNWLLALQDDLLTSAWRDEGYRAVKVHATSRIIRADSAGEHVALIIEVQEGPQYVLGKLTFRNFDNDEDRPLVFSASELSSQFAIREGEVFNESQIRAGIEALKVLYGSYGYIDFVAAPLTDINEQNHSISLNMDLDEEKQFRIGKVEVFTSNREVERDVEAKVKPNDVFDIRILRKILSDNAALLPPDISEEDMILKRDLKNGLVDVQLNLRPCPKLTEQVR